MLPVPLQHFKVVLLDGEGVFGVESSDGDRDETQFRNVRALQEHQRALGVFSNDNEMRAVERRYAGWECQDVFRRVIDDAERACGDRRHSSASGILVGTGLNVLRKKFSAAQAEDIGMAVCCGVLLEGPDS